MVAFIAKYLLLIDTSQSGKGWTSESIKTKSIPKELCEKVLAQNIGRSYASDDGKYMERRLSLEQVRQIVDSEKEGIEDILSEATDCLFVKDLTGKGINPFENPELVPKGIPGITYCEGYDSHGNYRSIGGESRGGIH